MTAAKSLTVSILIPTYNRPHQMAEAIASIASQDLALVGEVLVGDDSSTPEFRAANEAVIAASPIAHLIRYLPNTPAKGNYPNQWFLGATARYEYVLILHDDDHLRPGGLSTLATACANEQDPRVKIWFGRYFVIDERAQINREETAFHNKRFGRNGSGAARPVSQWCLTEALPPNSFLVAKETYTRFMEGPKDGNVGDWGFAVRLANSGAWGRFIAEDVSTYRVQKGSVTTAGRGLDAHRAYELADGLVVPEDVIPQKRRRFSVVAPVATIRYARDGERIKAWKCFFSPYWTWRQRLSVRCCVTLLMLLTPRKLWTWALHYR
ncbi:MAG: hypothetical protein NVS2B4_20820 [Ramlibacter sp.]